MQISRQVNDLGSAQYFDKTVRLNNAASQVKSALSVYQHPDVPKINLQSSIRDAIEK